MNLFKKPRESRLNTDFAETFECLPLVVSWYSHFCLVYHAIFIFHRYAAQSQLSWSLC